MKMNDVFYLPLKVNMHCQLSGSDDQYLFCGEGDCEAESIALAVNNYDKLVEAVRDMLSASLNGDDWEVEEIAERVLNDINKNTVNGVSE